MKSNSNERPAILQDLGNGYWHYNYNITKTVMQTEKNMPCASYDCDYVVIAGEPTYDALVKAVIRSGREEDEEFNLVNKYNAYKLGISDDISYKTNYENYLIELNDIKVMVKTDLETWYNQNTAE